MNEKEAAAFLGLTDRTLRRYRKKGTLPFREVKGKTRPQIQYAQADVERLKAELDQRRRRSKKPQPISPEPRRVSFGLPPGEHAELSKEAGKYGMRTGEYARRLVREGLESRFQAEAAELRARVQKLTEELRRTQTDYANGFEAVLEFVGMSAEEAKIWVDENLR